MNWIECFRLSVQSVYSFTQNVVVSNPYRLHEMADGELKDMEYFFSTLPTPFTPFDSEAYKTSVVGELTFSSVNPLGLTK